MPKLWPFGAAKDEDSAHDFSSVNLRSLLEDSDSRDDFVSTTAPEPQPEARGTIATEFDAVMDDVLRVADPEPIPAAPAKRPAAQRPIMRRPPKLATQPGDIVFVFGIRDDALNVAKSLQLAHGNIELAVSGSTVKTGARHIADRREAFQARADGVRTGMSVLVAVGLGNTPFEADQYTSFLADLAPEQVWLAVDVTRKPEDVRLWAAAVAEATGGVDAIAAVNVAETSTPDSAYLLGIPVGWADTPVESLSRA